MEYPLPVLDLEDFLSGEPSKKAAFANALGQTLERGGAVALRNRVVEANHLELARHVAQNFFGLNDEQKLRYFNPAAGLLTGYVRLDPTPGDEYVGSPLEMWHIGRGKRAVNAPFCPPNVWPHEISGFEFVGLDLFARLDGCAKTLLEACALYLGEPPAALATLIENGWSTLRLIHYPRGASMSPGDSEAKPHEDHSVLTLFTGGTSDGLEALNESAQWATVRTSPGTLVVGAGRMFSYLTKGRFRGFVHRVKLPVDSTQSRVGIPFFVVPRPETSLRPLPSCEKYSEGLPFSGDNPTVACYLAAHLGVGITNQ